MARARKTCDMCGGAVQKDSHRCHGCRFATGAYSDESLKERQERTLRIEEHRKRVQRELRRLKIGQ